MGEVASRCGVFGSILSHRKFSLQYNKIRSPFFKVLCC